MLRQRDRLLPVAALVALVAIGVSVLVLMTNAVDNGRNALEDSLVAEVEALARSQNTRLVGQLSSAGTILGTRELDFEVGSEADIEAFQDIIDLFEDAQISTGFVLTDAEGTITQGALLSDRSIIGEPLDRPGADDVLGLLSATPELPGAWLPVADGVTADVPTIALVFAVRDDDGLLRGTFMFETEIAADSDFNREISQLRRGDTGEYLVYDQFGGVIAANNPSLLGERLPDEFLLTAPAGLHRRDGNVQAFADVEASGWRIAFSQDADEFEEGLAGPVQRAGQIVVVVFVVVGLLAFYALTRRLRAAREEQERLQRLTETQEEFISIVSHELRTPVAGVLGFLQTTMDHWEEMTDTERFNALRRSASNARRLQGLTRDVLDSQSVESGRMSYVKAAADLREEVEVAVEAAAALYPRLTIEATYDAESVPVEIDVDRIQQVLTNLLDNAAKVSPPDQPVEVRLWREGDRAMVSVTDHGPGLSPELRERVFDKFVRGRSDVSGSGLGLYISRQILTAHDGDITVTSAPGGGASFAFDLPVIAAPVPG